MEVEIAYVHPYEQIAATIAAQIAAGDPPPGRRLPPVRVLVDLHGTTNATMHRALRLLSEQGWVTRVPNVGVFARTAETPTPAMTTADLRLVIESLEESLAELRRRVARLEGGVGEPDLAEVGRLA
ncbi:GntR family transcriptional regulator [Saccharothrix sp. NPDC042600]|uniref:GntR family transcriptional regulator n=1 Tax=Saccharothrix TaxID=2071 RepID=UPI0033EE3BDA|nr:hypothetical protein GCM10017745_49140 [Saccharothrix mutabilis subsp. capreolus]